MSLLVLRRKKAYSVKINGSMSIKRLSPRVNHMSHKTNRLSLTQSFVKPNKPIVFEPNIASQSKEKTRHLSWSPLCTCLARILLPVGGVWMWLVGSIDTIIVPCLSLRSGLPLRSSARSLTFSMTSKGNKL